MPWKGAQTDEAGGRGRDERGVVSTCACLSSLLGDATRRRLSRHLPEVADQVKGKGKGIYKMHLALE